MKSETPSFYVKTLYWGRYYDMYGEEWIDMESTVYHNTFEEAVNYAKEQCNQLKTIECSVYSCMNNELLYRQEPIPLELDHGQ